MSTIPPENNFYELSTKSNVPIELVELLFSKKIISTTDTLKVLEAVYSIKKRGITYQDKEILLGPIMFERVKKAFELLSIFDTDIATHSPIITPNIAAALGRYWWNN